MSLWWENLRDDLTFYLFPDDRPYCLILRDRTIAIREHNRFGSPIHSLSDTRLKNGVNYLVECDPRPWMIQHVRGPWRRSILRDDSGYKEGDRYLVEFARKADLAKFILAYTL